MLEEEPPVEPLEKLVFYRIVAVSGGDGLGGTYEMKLSSDGAFLYVASMNGAANSIFPETRERELWFIFREQRMVRMVRMELRD